MGWSALSLSVLLILNGVLLIQAQDICEDGWVRFEDMIGNGVCTLIVREPASWETAVKYCRDRLGKLLVLDSFGALRYDKPEEETSILLGEEMVENYNVDEFWSGLHVEKGRLMWNNYGPKLVIRPRFRGSQFWRWDDGQPDPLQGTCGKAAVKKTTSLDGTFYDYDLVEVNLTNCDTQLPYVCRKPPAARVVKTAAFCPDNWLGNQYIPYCYRIFKDPVSYKEAQAKCRKEGSGLAPSTSDFDKIFLGAVFNFYSQNDQYFEVTEVGNIWVHDVNTTESCNALNTLPSESRTPRLDDLDCALSLLFMCVTETEVTGTGKFDMRSPYFDQKKLSEYGSFEPLPVYGVLDRTLQENEVIFVRTPSFILNSTHSYQQWSFDNTVSWNVEESDRVAVPYFVNITLPFNQSPARRRRNIISKSAYGVLSERGKRQDGNFEPDFPGLPDEGSLVRNYDNIIQTAGFYTFGLYNINPPRYVEMGPQLVRYSEKDLFVYVVYCDVLDFVIGSAREEPFVTRENVNSFNLLQDDSYIVSLQEIGLSSVLNSVPEGLELLIRYYQGQIESFQNDTMKFRVFIAPWTEGRLIDNPEPILSDAVYTHFETNLPLDFFDRRTLKVRSTVACPFTQTTENGTVLTFEPMRAGETGYSWERCYPNNKALATATCRGGFEGGTVWRDISLTNDCGTVPEFNLSDSTLILKNLSETELTKDNFEKVLNDTVELTSPELNITEGDVIYTAEILYNYLQFDIVNTPEVMDTVFEVVDNVLNAGNDVIDSAQKITNAANRIILAVDDLTNKLELFTEKVVQFVQDFVASEVWEQSGTGDLTIGISLNGAGATVIKTEELSSVRQPSDVDVMGTDTAIYLTESLLKDGESRLAFHIYSNTDLFSVISSRFKVNSKVAAARLTKDAEPVFDLGDERVTAVFYIFEERSNLVCAYWNYSANEDAGGWETGGCTLTSLESGRVVCECNHLTNFAVLIDLEADDISDTDKLVLDIITKVGLIISIIGLGITIVTFLVFKHLRSGRGQQVLVNLSVAMICSSVLFLVGVDRTESYNGCIAVSVLLHYFILVTFMWMLVEGVLQYLRFVKVLGTYIPKFMIKSMVPAWGLPLIPVIIVLAIDHELYYGGNGYCWLSWKPFLYAFIIPVAVIILANIIVFTMVMCNLCCRRKNKGMVSNQSERKMAFLHFQAGISILVILGLTWLFGFLTIDDTRIVFHYLFAIFNAFQGFFIFMLFTAREKQIRTAWRKLCCKKSAYKSSTTASDSQPRKNSSDTNTSGLLSKSAGTNSISTTNGSGNFGNGDHRFSNPHYDNDNYN